MLVWQGTLFVGQYHIATLEQARLGQPIYQEALNTTRHGYTYLRQQD